jgi:hypothetical protein
MMSEACSKHGSKGKCEQNTNQKPKGKFGDLGVHARIIFYCIANK